MQKTRRSTTARQAKTRVQIFSAGMRSKRTTSERIADWLTNSFGTISFFHWNVAVFFGWLVWNSGVISPLPVFDPYPFGMLTMVVSLEAIFLSVIVLISQNRAAKIADLREEVALQVNIVAEQEVTQMLKMLERIEKRLSVREGDEEELARMKEMLDLADLQRKVVKELE